MRRLACLALLFAASAAPAAAHPAPFSYVDLRLAGRDIDLAVVVHLYDVAHELGAPNDDSLLAPERLAAHQDAIRRLIGERLHLTVDGRREPVTGWSAPEPIAERQSLRLRARLTLPRPPGAVGVAGVLFSYDPIHQTFVNVYEDGTLVKQAILSGDRAVEHFPGTRQGTLTVVRRFAAAGVHHILIGPDHLLFLVGLLLLGGAIRRLVLVVTAFTAAHSVTLSLAVLGLVSPPASIVEPLIALSIVYVGADNLTVREGRDVRVWIAFAFGLIHGFGFAGVLREMDLPARALGWSLFSFNLGVEIGQVAVVVAVASALAAIRARSEVAGRRLAVGGSLAVIAAGTFWFIERTF